ncbi:MAG: Lrp/AsnC family transcriptional regulator [Thermoplasmatota archaeon]
MRIDETNLRLLQLLQKNARMTTTELARAVGRSESTVRERLTSLELAGALRGYEARVDWSEVGLSTFVLIQASCPLNRIQEVTRQLAAIPNLTRAMHLTGPKPILAMFRVRDLQHLQTVLKERIAAGDLTDVETQIVIEELVDRRPPSLNLPGLDALADAERDAAAKLVSSRP